MDAKEHWVFNPCSIRKAIYVTKTLWNCGHLHRPNFRNISIEASGNQSAFDRNCIRDEVLTTGIVRGSYRRLCSSLTTTKNCIEIIYPDEFVFMTAVTCLSVSTFSSLSPRSLPVSQRHFPFPNVLELTLTSSPLKKRIASSNIPGLTDWTLFNALMNVFIWYRYSASALAIFFGRLEQYYN